MLRHVGTRKSYGPMLINCWAEGSCGMWVRHNFVEKRKMWHNGLPALELIWKCSECGAIRPFGLESITPPSSGEPPEAQP